MRKQDVSDRGNGLSGFLYRHFIDSVPGRGLPDSSSEGSESRAPDVSPAPGWIFEQAYAKVTPRTVRRFPLLYPGLAAAGFLAAAAFHFLAVQHTWDGFRPVIGQTLKTTPSETRVITMLAGFSRDGHIQIQPDSRLSHDGGRHYELHDGAAEVHLQNNSRPVRMRAYGIELNAQDAVFTVAAEEDNKPDVPVTVKVTSGTVHCCLPGENFPVVQGEKITLVKRGGETAVLAYETE